MDRAGVVVGGGTGNARSVVLGFPDVVSVGNARGIGVDHAQQDVVGIKPGVGGEALQWCAVGQMGTGEKVPDHGKAVHLNAPHQRGETLGTGLTHHGLVAGALVGLELAGAILLENIDNLVGDLFGSLIPGDALPLAFAALAGALERVAQAVGLVHGGGVDGTLLTPPGVGVGYVGVHLGILGDLLFAQDDAVLHIDIPATVAHAVDTVGGVTHVVPGPLVAVQVFPAAVRIFTCQRIADRLQAIERPDIATEHGASTGQAQSLQEIAPLQLPHPHGLLLVPVPTGLITSSRSAFSLIAI